MPTSLSVYIHKEKGNPLGTQLTAQVTWNFRVFICKMFWTNFTFCFNPKEQ